MACGAARYVGDEGWPEYLELVPAAAKGVIQSNRVYIL